MDTDNKEDGLKWVLGFLREHTFLLTGLPVLTTALLCLMADFFRTLELQAWNVPVEVAESANGGRYFYVVASGLLFYFTMALIPLYWYPHTRKDIFVIKIQLMSGKILRRTKRLLKKDKYPKVILKKNDKAKEACAELRKGAVKRIWSLIKYGLVCFASFCAIFYVNMGFGIDFVFPYCAIMAALMISSVCLFGSGIRSAEVRELKERRKKSKNDIGESLQVCEDASKLLCTVVKEKPVTLCKAEIVKYIFASLGMSILVFFASTTFVQWTTSPLRHDFWVYHDCKKSYVVVYDEGNKVVLEEVEIDGDDAKVYLGKQKSLERNGLDMEYRKFKHVERVKIN